MKIFPAIDLRDGKAVRLYQGDYDQMTVYSEDPVDVARSFKKKGASCLHLVDLDGAKDGQLVNFETIRRIVEEVDLFVEVGGGIRDDNAADYLNAGASAVIVTSYVFRDGQMNWENLKKLEAAVGADHLVLDVSCRRKGDDYYIVTDRWQKFTDVVLTPSVLNELADHCAEFLVHAVDVEGKARGIEEPLVRMLGSWDGIPVTYAGGVGSFDDLRKLKELGQNRLNVTIGSALDLFGGPMNYEETVKFIAK